MAKKRGGLGRGIGALIPQAASSAARPVDVFFPSEEQNHGPESSAKTEKIQSQTILGSSEGYDSRGASKTAQGGSGEADFSGEAGKNSAASGSDPQETLRAVPGAEFVELDLDSIIPNRANPRTDFDEAALQELTHSIAEFGVFQPIVVRASKTESNSQPRYEIIMGERRFRASKRAGLTTIPAIIRSTADENMLRDALLENLHRADLNPLEEASAYQQLMSDFGITQEQLAEKIGRSRPQISNTVRLLRLPERVQARVAAGVLSAGHARTLLSLSTAEEMQKLADKIINEGLTVREAEDAAARKPQAKRKKPRPGGNRFQLDQISERLSDRFDTKVSIRLGAKKGSLVIDFATVADLNRVLHSIGDEGFQ